MSAPDADVAAVTAKVAAAKIDAPPAKCPAFAKGNCPEGELCPLSHAISFDDPPAESAVASTDASSAKADGGGSSSRGGKKGPKMCSFFAKGNCKNGASCRFSHGGEDKASHGAFCQPAGASAPRGSRGKSVCKFFLKGACNNGASCRFSHEGGGDAGGGASAGGAPGQAQGGRKPKVCTFFLKGTCTKGAGCRFSHEGESARTNDNMQPGMYADGMPMPGPNHEGGTPAQMQSGQPPMFIDVAPGTPIYSIDVECGATTKDHNGRAVISIGMVDEMCRPMCSVLIKPDQPLLSCLTPITGVTQEDIDQNGVTMEEAVARVRACLHPAAVLVGQNILKDMQWLGLVQGQDYASLIDLTAVFRVWNPQHSQWTNFSQDHVAAVWLGVGERPSHNALDDATISMSLFNAYRQCQWDPAQLHAAQMATLSTPRVPSYAAKHGSVDGCCLGKRKTCTCDGAFFIS